MNRKFLLSYLLVFVSLQAMAALKSVNCAHPLNGESANNSQYQTACNAQDKNKNQNNIVEGDIDHSEKASADVFANQNAKDKESTSGALTFILLIPALLVFVFSGFKKSNK